MRCGWYSGSPPFWTSVLGQPRLVRNQSLTIAQTHNFNITPLLIVEVILNHFRWIKDYNAGLTSLRLQWVSCIWKKNQTRKDLWVLEKPGSFQKKKWPLFHWPSEKSEPATVFWACFELVDWQEEGVECFRAGAWWNLGVISASVYQSKAKPDHLW